MAIARLALALGSGVALASDPRHREIEATMRALTCRERTMALHVNVAVPDGAAAHARSTACETTCRWLMALRRGSW